MHKVWEFLKSRKLALTLLPIFIIPLVIGALFQQLNYIFSSWWFIALSLTLFLNTLFCTLSRIRSAWKATFREAPKASSHFIKDLKNHHEIVYTGSADQVVERVKRELILHRYRLREEAVSDGMAIFAEKGRFSVWGSVLFHLSLLLIFLGVLFGATTNLRGRVVLTEGQTFTERHQDYQQLQEAYLFRENHQNFQVRLDKLHLIYDKRNQPSNYASDVTVFDGGQEIKKQRVVVNNPLSYKGFVFYQTARYGFSPLLILEDSQGRVLFDAYVSLNTVEKEEIEFKDSFTVPDTTLRFTAQFYPHAEQVGSRLKMKSLLLKKPALYLKVSDGERKLFEGPLFLNQSTNFNGLALTFGGVRYWTNFWVTRDQGIPIIFTGFWVGLVGLALRFSLINKRIWAFLKEDRSKVTVCIGGRADRYRALFASEFTDIVEKMRRGLKEVPGC